MDFYLFILASIFLIIINLLSSLLYSNDLQLKFILSIPSYISLKDGKSTCTAITILLFSDFIECISFEFIIIKSSSFKLYFFHLLIRLLHHVLLIIFYTFVHFNLITLIFFYNKTRPLLYHSERTFVISIDGFQF